MSSALASALAAVAYAAKSSEDTRGSIPAQLADCRQYAEADGRQVVAEYRDEAASAYSGNRGPGLERALAHAERLAAEHGHAELWVQHSDRLARGDGKTAAHLVERALWALKAEVAIRSVQDPQTFGDLLYAVVTGQRNHEDSARKSEATRAGLARRKAAGKPVGALPDGYVARTLVEDGQAVTRRLVDDGRRAAIERIMDLIERGHTTGDVARGLNRDGLRTKRGRQWTARAVREVALNVDYTGATGYPPLVDAQRHRRIVEAARRRDPVARRARKGGRPAAEEFLLRGLLHCCACGESMYTRWRASGRQYVCGAVRQSRGTCDRPQIAAERLERAVVDHLWGFVGDARDWIAERVREADVERQRFAEALDRQRAELRKLRLRAERAHAVYYRLLDADDELAPDALHEARRIDRDADGLADAIGEAERRLADWQRPEVDDALDYFNGLRDAVAGVVDGAADVASMNAALRTVIGEAFVMLDDSGGAPELIGEFVLRDTGAGLPERIGFLGDDGTTIRFVPLLGEDRDEALWRAAHCERDDMIDPPAERDARPSCS